MRGSLCAEKEVRYISAGLRLQFLAFVLFRATGFTQSIRHKGSKEKSILPNLFWNLLKICPIFVPILGRVNPERSQVEYHLRPALFYLILLVNDSQPFLSPGSLHGTENFVGLEIGPGSSIEST